MQLLGIERGCRSVRVAGNFGFADADSKTKWRSGTVEMDSIDDLDLLGLTWDTTSVVPDTRTVTPSAGAEAHGVDREDEEGEGVDAKRQKRMRRNRESAAMSRERKKKHIDELEHKLAMLSSTVATLQAENDALRSRLTEVGVP